MHPQTPPDRRAFESPDSTPPAPHDARTRIKDRTRFARTATLVSLLLLAAIVVLVVLL
jgi:hypothetical protein